MSAPSGSSVFKRMTPDWRVLLSAAMLVLAFPPWNLWPLIWVALVPWFFALTRASSYKHVLRDGLWLSFFMSLGGFYWVAYVLKEFGELPWAVAILFFLVFAFFCQPQFWLFAPIQKWVITRRRKEGKTLISLLLLLGAALLYAGLDWVLPKLFVDTIGHSLWLAPRLRQLADLGGAHLLTALVFLINEAAFFLLLELRERGEPSAWPTLYRLRGDLGFSALAIGAAVGYGDMRLKSVHEWMRKPHRTIRLALIQANIGDFDKIAAESGIRRASQKILETYYRLSDDALSQSPEPDALVWPETSYPSTFRNPLTSDELARDQALERFVRERHIPLLFGGYDHANSKDYNSFFYLSPEPNPGVAGLGDLQTYHKNILLLFGEYIPLAESIKVLRDEFPQVGNFGRGPGPEVLSIPAQRSELGLVRTAPAICYEVLFPKYILEGARRGAELILNITNDSWFGPRTEPALHLALSTFRSVETRLPLVRSTNTGISALILPDGGIAQRTALDVETVMTTDVPLAEPPKTLMMRWGDWFGIFALLMGASLLLCTDVKRLATFLNRKN